MRIRLFIAAPLIVLFLCGSLLSANAQSQSIATPGPEASGELNAGGSNPTTRSKSEATWTGASEATCYTMRSYLVKRESPKSDVTSLVGYSTCLPSRNIELKRGEFRRSDLSRSKLSGSGLSSEFSADRR